MLSAQAYAYMKEIYCVSTWQTFTMQAYERRQLCKRNRDAYCASVLKTEYKAWLCGYLMKENSSKLIKNNA